MAGDRSSARAPVCGILSLQGDVRQHERSLAAFGITTRRIRRTAELEQLDGLVLPGGESSAMLKMLAFQGLEEPLGEALRSGVPVLATCAGLILCAREVVEPAQRSYGVLDLVVARNAWGRQLHSGTFDLDTGAAAGLPDPMPGIFIRAPGIRSVGADCEVLARRQGEPVLVRQGSVIGASFHPELADRHPVSALFVAAVRRHAAGVGPAVRT